MARRSESCPRLARKGSSPPVPSPPPLVPPVARSCTLQDLGPEDKQKVAKLLKQVVDLGQEVQQLKQQRDEQAKDFGQREQELQESNRQLHKEQQSLKKKLGQVLLVLRASQAKVNALEAVQQAPRGAYCTAECQTDPPITVERQEQAPALSGVQTDGNALTVVSEAPSSGQPPGADTAAVTEPSGMRASLAAQSGVPSLLHFAPGAQINITISHAHEPTAVPVAAPAPATYKQTEGHVADGVMATSASGRPHSSELCSSAALPAGGPDDGGDMFGGTANPLASAIIAIPTTTAAVAASTMNVSGPSADVALPELHFSSHHSPTEAHSRGAGHHMAAWQVQRPLQSSECASTAASVVAGGRTQREAGPAEVRRAACASVTSLGQSTYRPAGPRNITVDATMQQFENVPVHEVCVDSHEALMASPMIIPPSDEVVAAASSLLGWQAQHGFGATDAADAASASSGTCSTGAMDQRGGRKVLSYDPAIGKNGAFYFVDVADAAGESFKASETAAGTAATRAGRGGGPTGGMCSHGAAGGWVTAAMAQPREHAAAAPTAQHVQDRFEGEPPSLAQYPHAAPRPGPYMHDAAGYGRPNLGAVGSAHAPPHTTLAGAAPPLLRYPERPGPQSPCSSTGMESTSALTPSFHVAAAAQMHGCGDTPSSSAMSLSRMAVMLDDMARRQRWDVQPPSGSLQQQQGPGAAGPLQLGRPERASQVGGAGALGNYGAFDIGGIDGSKAASGAGGMHSGLQQRFPHGAGSRPNVYRHTSAGSGNGLTSSDAASESAAPMDSQSACGSSLTWLESNGRMERYDDSLVDILSQADEDLDQHQQQYQCRQQSRHQPQRPSAVPLAARPATRQRLLVTVASSSEGVTSRTKQQAASMEALLAANLYEENDVLSVILEQEGRI